MKSTVNTTTSGPLSPPRLDVVDALLRFRGTVGTRLGPAEPTVPSGDTGHAEQDRVAAARSLDWAQESADRGGYADALGWIDVAEELGAELPTSVQISRQVWALAHTEQHDGGGDLGA